MCPPGTVGCRPAPRDSPFRAASQSAPPLLCPQNLFPHDGVVLEFLALLLSKSQFGTMMGPIEIIHTKKKMNENRRQEPKRKISKSIEIKRKY